MMTREALPTMDIRVLPLVPEVPLPRRAPAAVRARVPAGYGVQEQCLPFTAANALGLEVPAPFSFGLCPPAEVPGDARAFRPPAPADDGDARVFYVRDRPASRYKGNAWTFDALPFEDERGKRDVMRPVQPGLSFFERADQAGLFKLHLPWVLRTPPRVDSVFSAPINRSAGRGAPLQVLTGLVETDWYAHPVNLVLRKPAAGSLRVQAGDIVAQVHFVHREARRAEVQVLQPRSAEAAVLHAELLRWFVDHARDRSAYRRLARSHQGRIEGPAGGEGPAG